MNQFQTLGNLSDKLRGIYFQYSLSENILTSLSKSGYRLLGLPDTTSISRIPIKNFIHPNDFEQIISKFISHKVNLNVWSCCSARVLTLNSKWELLFIKFNVESENDIIIINGIAHIIPGQVINSNLLKDKDDSEVVKSDKLVDLTDREKLILEFVCTGKRNLDIAAQLNISVHTVKTHRKRLIKKLGVNSVMELYRYCNADV